ncbi:ankyrin [Hyaloscypha variabilis F]|uniref:Ankyrin n=1 Tax=Hyaloscypha variabilis (strain UAMH 11265 / GT02V1 / F) TaxID=1149755 RepID=A0A2J6QZ36_HYAVF|nr:ankyrin [Hyaloscypha variabilis F]
MSVSTVYRSSSAKTSAPSSTPTASSNSGGKGAKQGRPNKWSASRQRKLARLYLYTILPREDIPRVLKDDGDNWTPGKESTAKTVNAILDKEPRWLRPKDRLDMDNKILGLSQCKTQRKFRRQWSPSSPEELQSNEPQASDAILSTEFSETPLEDLLAFAPKEPLRLFLDPSTGVQNLAHQTLSVSRQDFPFQEEPILPPSMLADISNVEGEYFDSINDADRLPGIDERSLPSTYLSTTSLKKRLSQYSSRYVKAIARIMKTHSISDSSAATTAGPAYTISINTEDASTVGARTIRPSSIVASLRSRIPRLILPDAILLLDRYVQRQGLCIPGFKSHDSKTCWCLEELDANSQVWVCQTGLINQQISDPPSHLGSLNIEFCDLFGDTVLHMLAARGADFEVIIDVLQQGVDGNAKNTAGQSFLHVLRHRFLTVLATHRRTLFYFLQKLNSFKIKFLDCDLFGRSFFHLLTRQARNLDRNSLSVLQYLNVRLPTSRDAFGWIAALDAKAAGKEFDRKCRNGNTQEHYEEAENTDGSSSQKSFDTECSPSIVCDATSIDSTPTSNDWPIASQDNLNDADALVYKHARLLEIATKAIDSPHIEDPEGRNGLQCLAEAVLDIDKKNALSENSNKRKRDQSKPDSSSKWLTIRYELAQEMVSLGVHINNYDKNGNTVLMAFVTHLPDGEDDKTLAKLFHHLIRSGANMHWRNRSGETALHIAVRLGHKVATRVLLESGANVHSRTSEGKGVLAVGETYYFRAREEPRLYASIMACMALCIQYGAVAAPTLVQEWSDRHGGFI